MDVKLKSLILREEQGLTVTKNRLVRGIFGHRRRLDKIV
jgi:hypothetical protein